ncbi:MAG: hypothetical protein ACETWE_09680 [Candidatus Bathyarchaeia archaeon]
MGMNGKWCKENYEKSITSRAWAATPYDAGWEESKKYGIDLPSSLELRAIFEEEMALDSMPSWAVETIDRMIGPFPSCGHYTFPEPLLRICEAIREERCPEFVIGCYTAGPERKMLMSYYVYCLDAWLENAPLEVATAELAMRDDLGKDWSRIIAAIYRSLGSPSEHRMLLVRRLVHRLRWWIKTLISLDDKRDRYMLDVFSGDVRGEEAKYGAYGNSPFGDPYFVELELPEMKKLAERIREMPAGKELLVRIESTWLCAPKVFRYLEKLILEIGKSDLEKVPDSGVSILQCEDSYPGFASCRSWYSSFMSSLTAWLEEKYEPSSELGDTTPVKHWLVRILRHKVRLFERYGNLGKLIGSRPSGRGGIKSI